MKRILEYVRPYYGAMLVGFAIKFVGTVMDLAIPWILSHIIDEVAPTGSRGTVWLWGGAMALCSALALLGNVIANRRASAVSRDVTRTLRHDLFAKVERLSAKQMDQTTVPSLISRLTTDSYNVNQTLGRIQRLGVRAPILLLGGVTVSLMLDFRLSLVLLATLPLLALSVALISRRGIPLYARVQRAVDDMVRTVRDDVAGVRVIRALSKGDTECARFARDSEALSREQIHADTVMAATNPLMSLLLNGGLTGVVVTGAFWVNAGLTEPGRIIAFLSYFTIILNAVLSINKMLVMLSQAAASAERIAEVLDLPEEAPLPAAAQGRGPRDLRRRVLFLQRPQRRRRARVLLRAPGRELRRHRRDRRGQDHADHAAPALLSRALRRDILKRRERRRHGRRAAARRVRRGVSVGFLLSGLHSRQRGSRAQSPRGTA